MSEYYYRMDELEEKIRTKLLLADPWVKNGQYWFTVEGYVLFSGIPDCCKDPEVIRYKILKSEYDDKVKINYYEVMKKDKTVTVVTEEVPLGFGKKTEHMHLCRDCGKPLYKADWCNEKEDHRISGRCAECWKRIGTVWMIEHAPAYGIDLIKAYHPEDTSGYSEDFVPYYVVSTGEHIRLPNVTWTDLTYRPSDGEFLGCENQAWILTEEEKEQYIELNDERQKVIDDREAEECLQRETKEREREKRKQSYKILQEHQLVQPRGGETGGVDGYWDAEVQSLESGVVTRVVVRNIFDFGYYGYPKSVEGTDIVFEKKQWTEDEDLAVKWAVEFSPLPHFIRM